MTTAQHSSTTRSTVRGSAPVFLRRTNSPLGRIELLSDGTSITSLAIERAGSLPWGDRPENTAPVLEVALTQLAEYFDGRRTEFDVPVDVTGTDFQKKIWAELSRLPYGSVVSYGFLGGVTGRATAGRAVGGAVGANPVPIIVPCHRVLAANGRITGFSAGEGIATKAWLLDHEGIEHRS
ncbi:methylated-DNA-[protein]-cysteine S-methyltransferase [Salinibacterium sp. CAN_S4]|uniref:methylated-DNA--[protein]-cysteine S-methyltransferase n=1 Tax=Salinibacterium sp. CAN_S4 TaxID=2787727 RepID=UPI0018EF7EE8